MFDAPFPPCLDIKILIRAAAGRAREKAGQAREIAASFERRQKLPRDLYLAGDFDRELLQERKAALEEQIGRLQEERTNLQAHLSQQVLTDQQIQTLENLAQGVRRALDKAKEDLDQAACRGDTGRLGDPGRRGREAGGLRAVYAWQ